jgi:ABC-type branched-subunit amino acid transport system substrate-binding protein
VTASTIKIGIIYPDYASLAIYHININQGSFPEAYGAQIAKINAAGGIDGRKIVPVYAKFSLLNPAASTQTCVQLTADDGVFAVLGTFESDTQALCYAQTHKTAVIGSTPSNADFALEQAPWFALDHGADDAPSAIAAMSAGGRLTGKKVAVIALQQDAVTLDQGVIPALKGEGITPVATAVMTASTSDSTALGSEVAVAVQKFQSVGANVVIVVGGMAPEYGPVETKTTYRPQLLFTSASDVTAGLFGVKPDPTVYKNALAADIVTNYNDPANLACVATMEAAYPALKGKLVNPTSVPAGKPTLATSVDDACAELALFSDIAAKAGKDLNYGTFYQAGTTLGKVHIPSYSQDADFTATTPAGGLSDSLYTFSPTSSSFIAQGS